MTIKERMEQFQKEYAAEIQTRLDNYYNDVRQVHALAITDAIREIEGWEMLLIKAHKEVPYADPKEADREHGNQMNLLATIKSKLEKKARPWLATRATDRSEK